MMLRVKISHFRQKWVTTVPPDDSPPPPSTPALRNFPDVPMPSISPLIKKREPILKGSIVRKAFTGEEIIGFYRICEIQNGVQLTRLVINEIYFAVAVYTAFTVF